MIDKTLNGFEPVGPQKHDRKIARNSINGRQCSRQRAHVETVEPQPLEIPALNSPSPCNWMVTDVDTEDASGVTDLLGEMKGGKALTAGNIQNAKTRLEIQIMEQGLGKRRGPIVVWRQRPTGCHGSLYHASLRDASRKHRNW